MKTLIAVLAMIAVPAFAAPKTVTLSVPKMDCAACYVSVNNALKKVAGVSKALVNMDKRETTVTYDDSKTNVDELTRATKAAGFPSAAAEE